MDWEEYLKNELEYYDQHPEEDDCIIEAHTNDAVSYTHLTLPTIYSV